jgi:hypothetical protein
MLRLFRPSWKAQILQDDQQGSEVPEWLKRGNSRGASDCLPHWLKCRLRSYVGITTGVPQIDSCLTVPAGRDVDATKTALLTWMYGSDRASQELSSICRPSGCVGKSGRMPPFREWPTDKAACDWNKTRN